MTAASAAIGCAIFVVVISTRVTGWTIDLPEVRRFYFEKYDSRAHEIQNEYNTEGKTFDNINGDSLHNTNEYNYYGNVHRNHAENSDQGENHNTYANSFKNYESYMVRKVQTALHNGTAYLEGLRRSIERYIQLVENCTRINYTTELPPEMTSRLSIGEFSGLRDFTARCREATQVSEHVRRLAELALHTTRRLQDVAFTSKYNKEDSMEENELLLRLAWYLDKLAHLTGYDPDPHAHTTPRPIPADSPSSPVFSWPLPEVSEEMKAAILNCLRQNSSEPATERCGLRVPQPALRDMLRMFGFNSSLFEPEDSQTSRVSRRSSDDTSVASLESPLELLLATDNKHALPPKLSVTVKSVQKRSVSDSADPLVKVLKYYAKHKVWTNSNPFTENQDKTRTTEVIDVKNSLHSILKRSVDLNKKIQKPEDPMQDLSKYIKSKPNIYYNVDRDAANRLKAALETIHGKKLLSKNKIKKLTKILRQKRALPVEHVRETIKTNTDIHYDIPKDIAEKLKTVIHNIPGSIAHLHEHHHPHLPHLFTPDLHHPHVPHVDIHHHGHRGHHEHVTKDIKTAFHYDNLHKEDPVEKIKAAVHHLHEKKVVIAKKIENLRKIFRPKRSIDRKINDNFQLNTHLRKKNVFQVKKSIISDDLRRKRAMPQKINIESVQSPVLPKKFENFRGIFRPKRSYPHTTNQNHHESLVRPRISMDPQMDISYYVKNKPGTIINRNLGQAALVRLSLEEAFQRGNINTVHKYGANYSPAIPLPFYTGLVRSLLDF